MYSVTRTTPESPEPSAVPPRMPGPSPLRTVRSVRAVPRHGRYNAKTDASADWKQSARTSVSLFLPLFPKKPFATTRQQNVSSAGGSCGCPASQRDTMAVTDQSPATAATPVEVIAGRVLLGLLVLIATGYGTSLVRNLRPLTSAEERMIGVWRHGQDGLTFTSARRYAIQYDQFSRVPSLEPHYVGRWSAEGDEARFTMTSAPSKLDGDYEIFSGQLEDRIELLSDGRDHLWIGRLELQRVASPQSPPE